MWFSIANPNQHSWNQALERNMEIKENGSNVCYNQ